MTFNTPLEIYDTYIIDELKKKHDKITNLKWFYGPPSREIGFKLAQDKLAVKKLLPIIFVFRDTPANKTDADTSVMKYARSQQIENDRTINVINVKLTYQIDLLSTNMFDMNKFNLEFFNFQKNRNVEFDFSELGLDFKNQYEVMFEEIEAENSIDEMFEIGRYYRYTYRISLMLPLFELSEAITCNKVIMSVYNDGNLIQQLQVE